MVKELGFGKKHSFGLKKACGYPRLPLACASSERMLRSRGHGFASSFAHEE